MVTAALAACDFHLFSSSGSQSLHSGYLGAIIQQYRPLPLIAGTLSQARNVSRHGMHAVFKLSLLPLQLTHFLLFPPQILLT
jgi:hypothetical protein